MSIPAKIKLSTLNDGKAVSGRISFSQDKIALMFAHEGDSFLITVRDNSMRVKKTGALSYDMTFKENSLSPVTLSTDQGTLKEFYMTTHSLRFTRKNDFFSAQAVYSFELSTDENKITLECSFYEN